MAWSELRERYDKGDYLGKLIGFPQQCIEGWELGKKFGFTPPEGIEKIFVTGMGGSGYSGELLRKWQWPLGKIPILVEHGYVLPPLIDKKTLAIVISHSGNTEEPLSIYKKLQRRGIPTIGIASGGTLEKICKNCIVVPGGMQPRQSTGYLFFSMLAVLKKNGLVEVSEEEAMEAISLMQKEQRPLLALAQKLAKATDGKLPLIYATESLEPSAIRWQTELNEIAKAFCHWNLLPEMQHNEINAAKNLGEAHFFLLRTNRETKKMRIRMDFTKKRIKEIGYGFSEIEAKGHALLANIWYLNYLGSLTAFHLAMLNHIDPTPVELIIEMKAYLNKRLLKEKKEKRSK
jgi:glucose/mannose-6-phosphate isomerase